MLTHRWPKIAVYANKKSLAAWGSSGRSPRSPSRNTDGSPLWRSHPIRFAPSALVPHCGAKIMVTLPAAADAAATEADCCEVYLVAPREGFALVPRRNARFCGSCAKRVAVIDNCPVCRANITMVIRILIQAYRCWLNTV